MTSTNRSCKTLNWNIRGMNSENKWLALRHKIDESDCNILSLQETKRETFDLAYLKKIVPIKSTNLFFFHLLGHQVDC